MRGQRRSPGCSPLAVVSASIMAVTASLRVSFLPGSQDTAQYGS